MDYRICDCVTCSQVVERALAIVCKEITTSDSCAHALNALGEAISAIGAMKVMDAIIEESGRTDFASHLESAMITAKRNAEVTQAITEYMNDKDVLGHIADQTNKAIDDYERMEKGG